jgi:hypothetical protein
VAGAERRVHDPCSPGQGSGTSGSAAGAGKIGAHLHVHVLTGLWIRTDFLMRTRIQHFPHCGYGSSSESKVLMTEN